LTSLVVRGKMCMVLRVKEKNEEAQERANYRLIYKRERRKTPCRLPKPERKAEYQC